MTKDEESNNAQAIYNLARECRVGMHAACRRIGMATSTPHRWLKGGSEPSPGHPEALRASILRIAEKRGTLPDKHRAEFEALPDEDARTGRPPREIVRDLIRNAHELERALSGGA